MFQWRGKVTEMWCRVWQAVGISALLSEMGSRIKLDIYEGAKVNLSVKMLGLIFHPLVPSFLDIYPEHFQQEKHPKFVSFRKDSALVDEAVQRESFPAISDVMHIAFFQNYVSCQGI